MKSKFIFLVLCGLVLFVFPAFASNDFTYKSNGDGTCTLEDTDKFEDVQELIIESNSPSGEKITVINDYAFYKCEAQSVVLRGIEAKIKSAVFEYSDSKSLTIEGCNLKIGDSFASNMTDLETLIIEDSVLEFDDYAFFKLGDDAKVSISNSKLKFKNCAFEYSEIEEMSISSCDIEADSSFASNCEDITSLTINDSALKMDEYAFFKLGDKASLTLTNCAGEFDSCAFEYSKITEMIISDCDLKFGSSAFSNNDKLISVKIGNGNYEFEEYAFFKCEKMTDLIIGLDSEDNQFEIGECFGEYCKKLTSVTIGSGQYEMGSSFLSNCSELKTVNISDSAQLDFDSYTFYNAHDDLNIAYNGITYDYKSFSEAID